MKLIDRILELTDRLGPQHIHPRFRHLYTTPETTMEHHMRASFDSNGNLILIPETNLERMACNHFVTSMGKRNKPSILVDESVKADTRPICPPPKMQFEAASP